MIHIKAVTTSADWEKFFDLPWTIYEGDVNWVPPLRAAVKDLLDVAKNPFFRHAEMYPLLAWEGDRVVGRAVGIIDDNHNRFHDEKTAFFGFFESVDNQAVATGLIEEVVRWARGRGMAVLRGPMNPSTNHECGLLVEGFNDPPTVMMTYNPPYYGKLIEGAGFVKAKDLLAYNLNKDAKIADKLLAHVERLRRRGSVTFRTARMSQFDEEIETILDIYNDAWDRNWGFVPMTPEEFRHMAQDLKSIADPELLLIAEVRGQPAGFALALPDVNQVLKKIPDGRLFPTGFLKLMWHLKGPGKRKTINRCRIVTLGIKKAFREAGIGPLFYTEFFKRGPKNGYNNGEASWILEDNLPMNRALEHLCGQRTKVYRIYDRALSE